ncbi:hypothetical protein BM536_006995, partial [Streptomyces phaeoluteigriseus]
TPDDGPPHRWFEQRAAAHPDRTALVCEDRALTYRELDEQAERLARALRARGAGPGSLVAVALRRSAELAVAVLAVHKAGAAYLPIDPAYPAERIGYVVEDAGPVLALTTTDVADGLPALHAVPRLLLDEPVPDAPGLTGDPAPADAAYTIYTSGSTGRPKGVVISFAAFANFLADLRERLELGEEDRFVAVTTFGFDIANLELFAPLISGARLVLAGHDTVRDPDALAALLTDSGATVMQATPTLWHALVTEHPQALAGLHALTGGEAISPALAARLAAATRKLTNLYGPTETTIWSTATELDGTGTPPIGRPLGATAPTSSAPTCTPYRPAPPASCTSAASAWPAATTAAPASPPNASSPTPSPLGPAPACTAPATWCGRGPTARSTTSAGSTTRSRCAASASNSVRSRPC